MCSSCSNKESTYSTYRADKSDFQGTLIVFNALEQLSEVSFAKATTASSLFYHLTTIRLLDSVLAAYSLDYL